MSAFSSGLPLSSRASLRPSAFSSRVSLASASPAPLPSPFGGGALVLDTLDLDWKVVDRLRFDSEEAGGVDAGAEDLTDRPDFSYPVIDTLDFD